ncbi:MAG: sporulation protein [Polaromonas sp.]|uniref:SPOR domain-containing protein n=1 Tax=Polaromonas sp. TaxID=1869339 RepID=UPI0017C47672|nr:SPOR domain-containing protein [Polaromonas sp.]NMM10479.1 sporulation protein [Polaromonas sp.]
MNKQRGGTLLGLIIGALIGLGAALAVAVYITKVPVPFMNKGQARSADSDATEAKKNKDWNPNAPLAGKNPIKPPQASGDVTDVTPSDPSVLAAPKAAGPAAAPSVLAPAPAKTAKPAASDDPLGDLAKARTKTAAPSFSSSVDPFNYFIQAGAFRTPEDAEQQRAKLSLLGMQAKVTERDQAGRTVYRVRLGPYDKKDEADKMKERLDNNSIETALVRVQR